MKDTFKYLGFPANDKSVGTFKFVALDGKGSLRGERVADLELPLRGLSSSRDERERVPNLAGRHLDDHDVVLVLAGRLVHEQHLYSRH